jgi:hypothetical protein
VKKHDTAMAIVGLAACGALYAASKPVTVDLKGQPVPDSNFSDASKRTVSLDGRQGS